MIKDNLPVFARKPLVLSTVSSEIQRASTCALWFASGFWRRYLILHCSHMEQSLMLVQGRENTDMTKVGRRCRSRDLSKVIQPGFGFEGI